MKLNIVMGSTRDGRAGQQVLDWVSRRAEAQTGFEVSVLDLREWKLPMFAETLETIGDFRDPSYSAPIVKDWNRRMREADAVIFITPEYNHSFSGELKNAIDSVFVSWGLRNKPAGLVAYSGSAVGGARAVEQLALVLIEAEMVPLRNTVLVGNVGSAFGEDGQPSSPLSGIALDIMLQDLTWWTRATQQARSEGELLPGTLRFREAMSAAG